MTTPKLDPASRALLRDPLDSFEKLELLRALRAAGRPMSAADLHVGCRLAPDAVHEGLGRLSDLAIIERDDDGKLFRVTANGRTPAFETLMSVYEEDRSIVLSTLTAMAMERMRGMAARAFADAFADAFVLPKRGEDDG